MDEKIFIECYVEADFSPFVLGCTLRDTSLREYDVQHMNINESNDVEIEVPLNENQIEIFSEVGKEGTLMLAIWKDDSFTERIIDTGWVKIEIKKTSMEELIDDEEFKKTLFKMLDSNDCKNTPEDLLELKAEEYTQEILYFVFKELGEHLPFATANEIIQIMKNDELEEACKLILEKIPNAKDIAKSALIEFREASV